MRSPQAFVRIPAYAKVEQYIRSLIESGEGREDPLPAEPELAERFGVTRMTVRQAFQRLVMSGLVVRYPGRGSYANSSVFDEMRVVGTFQAADQPVPERAYTKRILSYDLRKAPADVAGRFGVRTGTSMTYLEQVRFADGVPLAIDIRYMESIVKKQISETVIENGYLLSILAELGFSLAAKHIEIDARLASPGDAKVLQIAAKSAVLERRVFFSNEQDRVVMFGKSIYPAEGFTYRVSVRNLQGAMLPRDSADDLAAP